MKIFRRMKDNHVYTIIEQKPKGFEDYPLYTWFTEEEWEQVGMYICELRCGVR